MFMHYNLCINNNTLLNKFIIINKFIVFMWHNHNWHMLGYNITYI